MSRTILAASFFALVGIGFGRPALGFLVGLAVELLFGLPTQIIRTNRFFIFIGGFFMALTPPVPPSIGLAFMILTIYPSLDPGIGSDSFNTQYDHTKKENNQKNANTTGNTEPQPNKAFLSLIKSIIQQNGGLNLRSILIIRAIIKKAPSVLTPDGPQILQISLNQNIDYDKACSILNNNLNVNEKKQCVSLLIMLAATSMGHKKLLEFIVKTGQKIGLSKEQVDKIFSQFNQKRQNYKDKRRRRRRRRRGSRERQHKQNGKSPYDILGIDKNANKKTVKKAYKEKVKKYHPDSIGEDDNISKDEAEKRTAKINDAYKTIKRRRGWN